MEDKDLLKAYIERLAAVLHDHLATAEDLEANIGVAGSGGGAEGVADGVASLKTLRSSLLDIIEGAVEVAARIGAAGIDKEDLLDLYALVAYYFEAGLWRESTLLREAGRHVEAGGESLLVNEAKERLRNVMERLESLLHDAGIKT
ncbi:hypothetical protein APE_1645.1 [Aeropyrum pernix K1]|uniref:Uncharacterized protein n=1 Tax=Aeropyrum pernix (strain ATCC 700893 / DSM 11879 / JCM 9820 / NBRC 100138 / K1) TaxID=272557 RepID=Q9YBF2_AERPE|nr:hypothetical protein [Aeropyrum pernix]BAA80646.2 hypothetical protein APE_1645.1 [Aeropyrum pernix K1]